MLRITIQNTPTEQTWILQGRIVRPWAAELKYCWKKSTPNATAENASWI